MREKSSNRHDRHPIDPDFPIDARRRDFLWGSAAATSVAGAAMLFAPSAAALSRPLDIDPGLPGSDEEGQVIPAQAGRKMSPLDPDVTVIDAVCHAYNLSAANIRNRWGKSLANLIYGIHATWNPKDIVMPQKAFLADTPIEAVARTLFLESRTQLAVHHNLRLDSWFKDGLVDEKKNLEAVERWPDRFIVYVGVDPLQDQADYIADLRRQKQALPNAVGLKLYPHRVDPYKRWRADDPEIFKLFEEAQKLGIKNIAIHKAVPNGSVPMDPYKVGDIDLAADTFPDLNFEIVHAGMAFLEETAWAMARFPNVYANLEATTMLLFKAPKLFEEILAFMMFWAGPQKILWATGAIISHPRPLTERFWNLEISPELLEKYNIPQITKADKKLILGENYARLIGLDLEQSRAKVANDGFSKAVAETGLQAAYSNWKKMARVQ